VLTATGISIRHTGIGKPIPAILSIPNQIHLFTNAAQKKAILKYREVDMRKKNYFIL